MGHKVIVFTCHGFVTNLLQIAKDFKRSDVKLYQLIEALSVERTGLLLVMSLTLPGKNNVVQPPKDKKNKNGG